MPRTGYRAPRQNAIRERCLDRVLILGEAHSRRVLRECVRYFNHSRPHQGLSQRIPCATKGDAALSRQGSGVRATPILGGLHHAYARAA